MELSGVCLIDLRKRFGDADKILDFIESQEEDYVHSRTTN